MTTNKRRIIRQHRETELTKPQREYFFSGYYFGIGEPFETPEAEREAWERNREELLLICTKDYGLFSRCHGWWKWTSPEPKQRLHGNPSPEDHGETWFGLPVSAMAYPEDFETQKGYFLRHRELQTSQEKFWLKTHFFSRWELMGSSEMADEKYIFDHRELLDDAELQAFNEHRALSTAAGGSGLIQ